MQSEIHKRARRRVRAIKGFYIHAFSFIIMGLFFFFMNMLTDPFQMWFLFPMLPWSVGLAFHYLAVFGIPGTGLLSKEWEEREFEKQLDRLSSDFEPYTGELDGGWRKGNHLEYRELSDDETLELRKMTVKGNQYLDEDLV